MMNVKRSSKLNLTRYAFVVPAVMALLLVFSISKADFAKPVRITLANAVQPLARIININADEVANPTAKAANAPKVSKKVKTLKPLTALAPLVAPQAALSSLAAATVTLQPTKTDTTKKSNLIINGKKVVFVINGVVSPNTSFENSYPTNVERTTLLSGELAKKLAKSDDDKPILVAYIITKDAKNKEELENAIREDNDNDVPVVAPDNNIHVKPAKVFIVKSTTSTSSSTGSSNSTVTVNGIKAEPDTFAQPWAIVYEGVKPDKAIKMNGLTIATNGDKEPFIVIDGKNSTMDTLKKLNPDKIESISILKGDDATKKYGDKAKDGVIVIGTHKK